jgi:hypothetical protein
VDDVRVDRKPSRPEQQRVKGANCCPAQVYGARSRPEHAARGGGAQVCMATARSHRPTTRGVLRTPRFLRSPAVAEGGRDTATAEVRACCGGMHCACQAAT